MAIRYDKLSTAVATDKAHPDKYKKDSDVVVAFLTQYIDKRGPKPSVRVVSVGQTRPAQWQQTSNNHGTFKGKIELKKYSREEYDSKSMPQCQQLYKLQKKIRLIKSKKTPESSRVLEARVAVLEAKQIIVAMRAYLKIKSEKLITEIVPTLTEREATPDRAVQTIIFRVSDRGQSAQCSKKLLC